jgi:general transcription factor 3C polypeptide 3 (transcription factor C subunit 4)
MTLMVDYLLRAYELNPYDSYICLLIAQSFFGRSMNRQSDNRNYQIAQVSVLLLLLW